MGVKGYVMQAQPFSVNDGDGIRTILFLAGCPMHCKWCSNPEGMQATQKVGWYERNCIGCGACAKVCPQHIGINLNLQREHCISCGACVAACPKGARSFLVSYHDADDLIKAVEKDATFLRGSNGGVTFSGGEATYQTELLDYLSQKLYDLGYSLDIETCGYFNFDKVKHILARMDLIFMDIKHMDDEKHRFYTGLGNEQTLANVSRLNEVDARVVIRIPTIGGVNDDEENIRATACYVHEHLPKARIELLPYHKYGTIKYEALGLEQPTTDFYRPDAAALEHLRDIVRSEGVDVADFR
ncbi:MAG: glycyl-radical enzyme activating protein [Phascolarctobacterium sp.]|nr:glycyl-radical enzyme activating protein [Phascolarctobacterium sp.]